jgi:hypothetical protein
MINVISSIIIINQKNTIYNQLGLNKFIIESAPIITRMVFKFFEKIYLNTWSYPGSIITKNLVETHVVQQHIFMSLYI